MQNRPSSRDFRHNDWDQSVEPMLDPILTELTADGWERRYQEGSDRWDLGCPAPPLDQLLNSDQAPLPGRMAGLGIGSGQDAMRFAAAGFDVVGFDFAPSAIARATANAQSRGLTIAFHQQNIFELAPEWHHGFDYVLEHTCFCAIDPALRSAYVQVVRQLLRPQGKLIALFFTHSREGGPPFGVTPQAIRDYFEPDFELLRFELAMDSVRDRQGEEHLAIFQVR
jgi:methyl halide transferase